MENSFKIFVVEDDTLYGSLLEYHLTLNPDYVVEKFETSAALFSNIHKLPNVITLDYSLPDANGIEILKRLKREYPDIPVIMISGQEDISIAISVFKLGVYDYIVKDQNTKEHLWNTILKIRENFELKEEISQLREEVKEKYNFENSIKGNSSSISKVFALMEKASKSNITVAVYGETGTGKELVSKSIHFNSLRSSKPFVAVNVAAIPRELIESELFGYEKGAFTGAVNRRIGKFEEANGGTIFLDEIGEMELTMQAKLLRVLQEQEVTRIGGTGAIKLDMRVIIATHRNLAEEVKNGNFREDLYYRLLGLNIMLPPLRDREKDALILSKFFIDEYCKKNKIPKASISPEASLKILAYSFPGNIRELKAIIELAVVMCSNDIIEASDITFNSIKAEGAFLLEDLTLKEYNRRIISHFLEKFDNDVMKVADKLDIGKSTIYNMIKNGEIN